MKRSIVAVAAAVLVAASISGATEQPLAPIETRMPAPHFGTVRSGPFSLADVRKRARPLGPAAPGWARRLYRRSLRVLIALTDPRSGAMIAGERDGWDYVWPRDAAAGTIALEAAGLRPEARRVARFLSDLDLDQAARFYPDGSPVPGRPAAGDAQGWVAAAVRSLCCRATRTPDSPYEWQERQDYGENVNRRPARQRDRRGRPSRRDPEPLRDVARPGQGRGSDELDSSAAWAATLFPSRGLRGAVRQTLLALTRESTRYGIPPMEGWTPGEVWTAPTAWSAWALIELGERRAADRLLAELHRAETPHGTLPERVDAATGAPTSTTPLAWSHAFAILALRARYD